MAINSASDDVRIDLQLPAEMRQLIEEAALYRGQSIREFALSTLINMAQAVVQEHQITKLSNRDRDQLLALLDSAPEPNDALIAAAQTYRDRLE